MKTEMDPGLLETGWAGNPDPDEYEFIREKLNSDPDLAFRWGFKPKGKEAPNPGIEEVVSDRELEVPRPEVNQGPARKDAEELTPYQMRLIA